MQKNKFKLIWAITFLLGLSIACETFSAINRDYKEARSTADIIATKAQQIITQAQGAATQISDSQAAQTAHALATQYGPSLVETGQSLATQVEEEGYLLTAEALVTQGSAELLPTIQALTTQHLDTAPPAEDIPILTSGEVTILITNQYMVSYYVQETISQVLDFYQTNMPNNGWIDVSNSADITEDAAVLKFFKPDRVASITLSENPLGEQTVVLITIRTP
jgi:hypothetical protein